MVLFVTASLFKMKLIPLKTCVHLLPVLKSWNFERKENFEFVIDQRSHENLQGHSQPDRILCHQQSFITLVCFETSGNNWPHYWWDVKNQVTQENLPKQKGTEECTIQFQNDLVFIVPSLILSSRRFSILMLSHPM